MQTIIKKKKKQTGKRIGVNKIPTRITKRGGLGEPTYKWRKNTVPAHFNPDSQRVRRKKKKWKSD